MSSNGNLVVEHTTIVYPDLDFTSADHAIVVTAGRISWVGPTSERPMVSPDTPKIDGSGTYTMPGLIDCHTHITFDAAPIALENETLTDTDLDLRCKANLEKQIAAGVTTIRDCGSWRRRATLYADNRDNIWPRSCLRGSPSLHREDMGILLAPLSRRSPTPGMLSPEK